MLKPFYMLDGHIDLVKETKPFELNGKMYVEKTYMDENEDKAIVAVPIKEHVCHGMIFTECSCEVLYIDKVEEKPDN